MSKVNHVCVGIKAKEHELNITRNVEVKIEPLYCHVKRDCSQSEKYKKYFLQYSLVAVRMPSLYNSEKNHP